MDLLSKSEKELLAGRSRTLQERLDRDLCTGSVDAEFGASVDEYVAEWREAVADGDPDAFRRRLALDDLDVEDCRRRIADDRWPDDEPLPEWVAQLEALLSFVQENPSVDVSVSDQTPFSRVLAPFLEYAREEVDVAPSATLSPAAINGLTTSLARRLTRLWRHTLFVEFKTSVARDDPDLVFDDDVQPPEGSTRYYDEFTEGLLDGGLPEFFVEYAFLARLVVSVIHQWIDRVEEFADRLTDDWAALEATFGDGRQFERVAEITTYGDPHQGGREVYGVTFESGTKIAYKPRNAGIVIGFYDLLDWVNATSDDHEFRTLEFVSRDDYAWMEWVDQESCDSEAEAVEYYHRAGMLICLFYAMAATDMHLHNIIAEGNQPVSVDLETLAAPVANPEMRAINETVKVVADTIVRTGVVPRHVASDDVGDMAGFSVQRGRVSIEGQQFTNTNTDRMDLEMRPYPDREGANLPTYDGEVVGPRDNLDVILDGFEAMYRFLLDHEEALLAEDGPIAALADGQSSVRVLYRPTSLYGRITEAMESPGYLRTGVQFGIKAETLGRLVVTGDVDPAVWSIYEAERDVLREYNTPRFSARLDSTDVFDLDETVVEEFFRERPIDQIRERIRSLDERDLDEQLDYLGWGYGEYQDTHTRAGETRIETLLDADVTAAGRATPSASGDALGFDGCGSGSTDDAASELAPAAVADEIFDRIVERSRIENGDPTWVLREVGSDGGLDVHPIGDRLYDGRVGIALFAAGLEHTLGDDRYGAFARRTLAPILRAVEAGTFENHPDSILHPPRPVGGGVGLGSIVYGLTRVGAFLDDPAYVSAAAHAASLIDRERVGGDREFDVLHGSAGAILGLLALYDATGDDSVLDRAVMAGEHLLASASDHDGALAWRSAHSPTPLCGFSHGAAGISYALVRLGDATGDSRFETAGLAGVEYENQRYDPDAGNWPDLRAGTDDWFDGWCHGRTGIGLARLGASEVADHPSLRRDLDRALQGTDPSVAFATDHVCCGNFGRVEFLLRAGRALDDPAYCRDARRLAAASVQRAARAGRFTAQWQTDHWYNPGLFGGEAGIGYTLLRLADESIPSVLLLE